MLFASTSTVQLLVLASPEVPSSPFKFMQGPADKLYCITPSLPHPTPSHRIASRLVCVGSRLSYCTYCVFYSQYHSVPPGRLPLAACWDPLPNLAYTELAILELAIQNKQVISSGVLTIKRPTALLSLSLSLLGYFLSYLYSHTIQ